MGSAASRPWTTPSSLRIRVGARLSKECVAVLSKGGAVEMKLLSRAVGTVPYSA
jgi:hypothetical protein